MIKLKIYLDEYVSLIERKEELTSALGTLEDLSRMPLTTQLIKEELSKVNKLIYNLETRKVEVIE